jgi:hypothetical protein
MQAESNGCIHISHGSAFLIVWHMPWREHRLQVQALTTTLCRYQFHELTCRPVLKSSIYQSKNNVHSPRKKEFCSVQDMICCLHYDFLSTELVFTTSTKTWPISNTLQKVEGSECVGVAEMSSGTATAVSKFHLPLTAQAQIICFILKFRFSEANSFLRIMQYRQYVQPWRS